MKLDQTRAQDADLPREVTVIYSDSTKGYEQGSQYARRISGNSIAKSEFEMPIAMTAERAKEAAETALYCALAARISVKFSSDLRLAELEPGDAVLLKGKTRTRRVRLTNRSDGAGILKFEAVEDNRNAYGRTVQATSGTAPPTALSDHTAAGSPSLLDIHVYDLGRLDQADPSPVAYASVTPAGGNFTGGRIYVARQTGGLRDPIAFSSPTKAGFTIDKLAAPGALDGDGVDTVSRVTVEIGRKQTLSSITRAQMLAGGGMALIGKEILHFQDATLVAEDTYELKNFLRGKKGTEAKAGRHDVFDSFVLLSTAIRIPLQITDIGVQQTAYALSLGMSMAEATMAQFTISDGGTVVSNPTSKIGITADGVELAEGDTTDVRRPTFHGEGNPGDYASVFTDITAPEAARVLIGGAGRWSFVPNSDIADGVYAAAYKTIRPSQVGPVFSEMSPSFAYELAPKSGSATYQFWRVFVTAINGGNYLTIDQFDFYTAGDVRIEIPFGNWSSSGSLGDYTYGPQFAFYYPGSAFASAKFSGSAWVKGWFNAPMEIAYITLLPSYSIESGAGQAISFEIQGSTDGDNWTTVKAVTNAEPMTSGSRRVNF